MSLSMSIITVVRNGEDTIRDCLSSVAFQSHRCVHVIIDGGSTDNTLEVVSEFPHVARLVSEPDCGIYDAMNKGIARVSGDIIGILNSDDFYVDNAVLSRVANAFAAHDIQSAFGDLVYVKKNDTEKIVRYYSSAGCTPEKFAYGWMPAHPTFFVRRHCYEEFGLFKTDYRIAADFELLARFLAKNRISYHYLPEVLVKMRSGGVSTKSWRSNVILNREIVRACRENGIATSYVKVYSKYFAKVSQLLRRPAS
jgi:glycosyltransferase involved in cell wall biosynthesis